MSGPQKETKSHGQPETDPPALPRHVAVIMDGNGRWAKSRSLPRVEGHRVGAESVRDIVKTAGESGIEYITLYAFSVENWNRPQSEVDTLMRYLADFLRKETSYLNKNNVRLEAIGQIQRLPEKPRKQLEIAREKLKNNTGITLTLALSYGGRTEIVEAVRSIASEIQAGKLQPEEIDEQLFANHLYTKDIPDPDLLIRTSGEMRISNFLLWQISYTELIITETLWPDFRKQQFLEAMEEYKRRKRRFGRI